jgi:maleate cis-trans isomerase
MSIAHGGTTNQGQPIGILMLDTKFPRVPGDVGNAFTFNFPVRYQTVLGANPTRVVKEADPTLLQPFIDGAKALEAAGCGAISTSCGFLVMFQKELADAVKIPVISSSLLQVPFVAKLIGSDKKVGIITARAASLTQKHFVGAGMEHCNFAIQGMEDFPEFTNAFIEGNQTIDLDVAEAEMVQASRRLVLNHPEVRAIVLECTNMPPFAHAVAQATGLPVFDIVTLIRYTASALLRGPFTPLYI